MKNVLIFEPYPFQIFGNQKYITFIFQYLDKKLFRPLLATPVDGQLRKNLEEMGFETVMLQPTRKLQKYGGAILREGVLSKIFVSLSLLPFSIELSRLIKKERIDLIHCNNLRGLLMTAISAKLTGIPCLWFVKGELKNPILDTAGFFLADRILFLANGLKDPRYRRLFQIHSKKISNLGIGIELDNIRHMEPGSVKAVKEELAIDSKNVNVVFVGYIDPSKGIHLLIQAFGRTKAVYPNTKLYIVGDSPLSQYQQELSQLVSAQSITNDVIFTGWRPDVLAILASMNIFVLPSVSEGVPRSIIEAMAVGMPVIATSIGGIPETVIEGKTGLLVPPGRVSELEKALNKLIGDGALRSMFGQHGKEIAHRKYSIENHIKNLEFEYLRLCGNRGWLG